MEKQETEVRKEAARRKGNGKLRGACAWFVIRARKTKDVVVKRDRDS